jgi:hypothetical protein
MVEAQANPPNIDAVAGAAPVQWGIGAMARAIFQTNAARAFSRVQAPVNLVRAAEQEAVAQGVAPQQPVQQQAAPQQPVQQQAAPQQQPQQPVQQQAALQQPALQNGEQFGAGDGDARAADEEQVRQLRAMAERLQSIGQVVPAAIMRRLQEAEAALAVPPFNNANNGAPGQGALEDMPAPPQDENGNVMLGDLPLDHPLVLSFNERRQRNRLASGVGVPPALMPAFVMWLAAAPRGAMAQLRAIAAAIGRGFAMQGQGKTDSKGTTQTSVNEGEVQRLDALFQQFRERMEVQAGARGVALGGGDRVDDRPGDGTNVAPPPPRLPLPPPALEDFTRPEALQGNGAVGAKRARERAAHTVKGSAAAIAHMERLRAMRKKNQQTK